MNGEEHSLTILTSSNYANIFDDRGDLEKRKAYFLMAVLDARQ